MVFVCYVIIEIVQLAIGIYILHLVYLNDEPPEKIRIGIFLGIYALLNIIHLRNMWDSYISNISIVIESVLLGLACSWYFRSSFLSAFTLFLLYFSNLSLLRLPVLIVEGVRRQSNLAEVNRDSYTAAECVWSAVILLLFCWLIQKNKKNWSFLRHVLLNYREWLLGIAAIQWCVLSCNMWLGLQDFHPENLFLNLVLILVTQIYMQYLVVQMAQRESVMEIQRLDMAQGILQRRNKELQELYDKNSSQMHEVYHDMMYLYHCLAEHRYGEAEEFAGAYISQYEKSQRKVWTGLPFLDFLINYKKEEMDKNHIDFQLFLDVYDYPFEDRELGTVFGNLLDNAIEACQKCEEERYIHLQIRNVKKIFILRLKNSSIKEPKCRGGRFLTDKKDTNAHGMGVEQVKRIVSKYGGDIEFRYDSEHFEVNIIVSKQ